MGIGSRNGVAKHFGINEPRLRQNEGAGQILPRWKDEEADTYLQVVEAWQALRNAGWTNVEVRKAFAAIRRQDLDAAWREWSERLLRHVGPKWEKMSPQFRDGWLALFGAPPAELTADKIVGLYDEHEEGD